MIYRKTIVRKYESQVKGIWIVIALIAVAIVSNIMYFDGPLIEAKTANDFDPNYTYGDIQNQRIVFNDDVIIGTNVSIENCSLFFEDDYLNTYGIYVQEKGSLLIRNSTIDAQYEFRFEAHGNLTLENVTIRNLWGSILTTDIPSGLLIVGNASISSSRIEESNGFAIYVYEGNLNLRNTSIHETQYNGIRAIRSEILIENCTFSETFRSDIYLKECDNAVITHSTVSNDEDEAIVIIDSTVSTDNIQVEKDPDDNKNLFEIILFLLVIDAVILHLVFIVYRRWKRSDIGKKYGIHIR